MNKRKIETKIQNENDDKNYQKMAKLMKKKFSKEKKNGYIESIEIDMRKTRSTMYFLKKKETLIRASVPRSKISKIQKRKKNQNQHNFKLKSSHEEHLKNLKILKGEKLENYKKNYFQWEIRRNLAKMKAIEIDKEKYSNFILKEKRKIKTKEKKNHFQKFKKSLILISYNQVFFRNNIKRKQNPKINFFFKDNKKKHEDFAKSIFEEIYHEFVVVNLDVVISDFPKIDLENCKIIESAKSELIEKKKQNKSRKICCDEQMFSDKTNGTLVCKKCGNSKVGGEGVGFNPSYAEMQSVSRVTSPYERIAHFKEFIARLEGSERTEIPEIVINKLLFECASYGIDPLRNPSSITYSLTRSFLQRTGYAHFFENIPQIISILTRRSPITLTSEQRKKLTMMFKEIQLPFEKYKGKRKNFLSYSYTTYKSCELLGMNHFLPMLPLLKASQNMLKADEIWEKICHDCGYEFIRTT
tara:strand:+ start:121 stop:1530 length:1410 start_codon:yes stop_codon:yes gene_type:complete